MPYFKWQGVDVEGRFHKGVLFARSQQELDRLLIKNEIALLRSSVMRRWYYGGQDNSQARIYFFSQLVDLLKAGVLLPEALEIVAAQMPDGRMQEIIGGIMQGLYAGNSLSVELALYPAMFDSLVVQMVHVGEESGNLPDSLARLVEYLQIRRDFSRQIRSAMLVPAITFIFFMGVSLVIFMGVVPYMATLFESAQQSLPFATRMVLGISNFLRAGGWLYIAFFCMVMGIFIKTLITTKRGKAVWGSCMLYIPLVGTLLHQRDLTLFLRAASMLLQGGVSLVKSLEFASTTVTNTYVSIHIDGIIQEVKAGSSLSHAMIHTMAQIFSPDVIAVVRVGEEAGRLAPLLSYAAGMCRARIQRSLSVVVMMVNPLLMITLGLFVAGLIMSVYMPIFTMANIV
jgi:type II secretory pathway component PulF